MDQRRFDALARALGAGVSRRAGLAALLGTALGTAPGLASAGDRKGWRGRADARDAASGSRSGRRSECSDDRPCADGFACRKQGHRRRCVCPSGMTCGEACCAAGEACRDGACAAPPPTCQTMGEACGGGGRPCCDGLQCASGQGGKTDVACYVPAGGACEATAECVYGAACRGGACVDVACHCTVCAGWDAEANGVALQAALDAAAPGSTVLVQPGTYAGPLQRHPLVPFDDAPLTPLLVVPRPLTIARCGQGEVTLSPVVIAGDGEATLRGLTLTGDHFTAGLLVGGDRGRSPRATVSGCRVTGQGTGLVCLDGALTVDDGTEVADCWGSGIVGIGCDLRIAGPVTVARNREGGIHVGGGTLRATGDVRVVDNVGYKQPGGIYVGVGCWAVTDDDTCILTRASAHLEGTTVSGNVARSTRAGGIHVSGDLVATNVTVRGNWSGRDQIGGSANYGGGGIAAEREDCAGDPACDPGGRVTLIDSLVEGNRSGPDPLVPDTGDAGAGGGIALFEGSSLAMLRTRVADNVALPLRNGGAGFARGGGISLEWTTGAMPLLEMDAESRIVGNAAEGAGAQGGGIYASAVTGYTFGTIGGNTPDQCICVTCPPP